MFLLMKLRYINRFVALWCCFAIGFCVTGLVNSINQPVAVQTGQIAYKTSFLNGEKLPFNYCLRSAGGFIYVTGSHRTFTCIGNGYWVEGDLLESGEIPLHNNH